ncbi:hypothetical protein BV202_01254A, partial [Haemophilus influenzae]
MKLTSKSLYINS